MMNDFFEENRFVEVGDLIESAKHEKWVIPIFIKNEEVNNEDGVIIIEAVLTEITDHVFPVNDYNGFHLECFRVEEDVLQYEDLDLGSGLQKYFPTLYRGVQTEILMGLTKENLC